LTINELIKQIENKEDRRLKRLSLVDKGKNLINNIQYERLASNKMMLEGLSKSEKEMFLNLLQRITKNILLSYE